MNIDRLVAAAQQGNKAAGEEVLATFRPLVEAAAAQRWLRPLGEDALGQARLSLWLAVYTFNPALGIPFAGYAKNKVYNDLRSYFRHERLHWQHEVMPEQMPAADGSTLFDTIADEHDGTREFIALQELLDPLTEHQRRVVQLVYLEGLTQTEAARQLGVSRNAVGKSLRLALQKLRLVLTQEN